MNQWNIACKSAQNGNMNVKFASIWSGSGDTIFHKIGHESNKQISNSIIDAASVKGSSASSQKISRNGWEKKNRVRLFWQNEKELFLKLLCELIRFPEAILFFWSFLLEPFICSFRCNTSPRRSFLLYKLILCIIIFDCLFFVVVVEIVVFKMFWPMYAHMIRSINLPHFAKIEHAYSYYRQNGPRIVNIVIILVSYGHFCCYCHPFVIILLSTFHPIDKKHAPKIKWILCKCVIIYIIHNFIFIEQHQHIEL